MFYSRKETGMEHSFIFFSDRNSSLFWLDMPNRPVSARADTGFYGLNRTGAKTDLTTMVFGPFLGTEPNL